MEKFKLFAGDKQLGEFENFEDAQKEMHRQLSNGGTHRWDTLKIKYNNRTVVKMIR